jgi:hypothetical protein
VACCPFFVSARCGLYGKNDLATKEGNRKFVVERSLNRYNYTAVGEVAGRTPGGYSNTPITYTFAGNQPFNGKQYYRFWIVSLTGSEKRAAKMVWEKKT